MLAALPSESSLAVLVQEFAFCQTVEDVAHRATSLPVVGAVDFHNKIKGPSLLGTPKGFILSQLHYLFPIITTFEYSMIPNLPVYSLSTKLYEDPKRPAKKRWP
ncbi:hypothetical protein BDV10DRAFT_38896 [Aspergillus recurvatus]